MSQSTSRRVWRRTDVHEPGSAKVELKEEALRDPLPPTWILIRVRAVSLNWRDAKIVNGQNPWPVIPKGIAGSDAVGEVIQVGDAVSGFEVGDRASPILDQAMITGREPGRCWLVADVDGVLATHLAMDEKVACKMPKYLDWNEASTLPCAGLTAWSALKGVEMGASVLIQRTGGVSMIALRLARARGCKVIVSSSSDAKLDDLKKRFHSPPLLTFNYATDKEWEKNVLDLTDGNGVDLTLENGGASSLVQSMKATRRGGIVSQVVYLGKQEAASLQDFIPTLIDRRIHVRGINCGSKLDLDDFCAAVLATEMRFHDILDKSFPFDRADEAIEFVWQSKQVGKVVIEV